MDCPICTGGKGIPVGHVERHLTNEQHGIDPKIAKLIAYLNKRVEILEQSQR